MPYYRKLVGEQCYLSPCQPDDAEKWAQWFNDLAVTVPLGDEAYSPAGLERMRSGVMEVIERGEHVFTIVTRDGDEAIGRCLLFAVDQVNRSAMVGIAIGERAYWGRGFGEESLRLLLEYAFGLLNLNSVMLGVFAFNERALRLYRKVGFKEIGRRREARLVAGVAHDAILMDILAREFPLKHLAGLTEGL
jgi:RimJ/RimL family protein N-acetyltransferase